MPTPPLRLGGRSAGAVPLTQPMLEETNHRPKALSGPCGCHPFDKESIFKIKVKFHPGSIHEYDESDYERV